MDQIRWPSGAFRAQCPLLPASGPRGPTTTIYQTLAISGTYPHIPYPEPWRDRSDAYRHAPTTDGRCMHNGRGYNIER